MSPIITDEPDDLIRRFIQDGMRVHITTTTGRPNALLYAMCRVFSGRRSLMVSIASIHSSAHALALSGAVKHVTTCFLGDSYPSPRPSRLYTRLKEGIPFHAEIWSLLSHTQRLAAAASGLPYAVTASLIGSHLPLVTGTCPPDVVRLPGEQPALLVPVLRPDVTLLHGVIADRHGNIVMCRPFGEGPDAAFAASEGVIATVERIVPDRVVATMPGRVTVPGSKVIGLCEARWGGHPQSLRCDGLAGLPDFYLDDYRFLAEIAGECASPETAQDWYRHWVAEPVGHSGYLSRLGPQRLRSLAPTAQRRPPPPQARLRQTPCTDQEMVILLAARGIVDLVRERGYRSLLAGVGAAHMAAWTAREILSRQGIRVELLAELGFYGFSPEPGDPFLFSQLHASRSTMTAGVGQILGNVIGSAPHTSLGVLGAVEVDATGAVNTAFLPDGRWLTGPGGANDVGTRSDCVVVAKATRARYVAEVAHVTTPGTRVQAVFSQFGTFTRAAPGELFSLSAWLPSYPGKPGSTTPAALVSAHTCWEPPTRDVKSEPAITADERSVLASFDPEGIYR